ncbi:MAG TPA: hypothetical protein VK914_11220 [bacterium]|jgi:hypothetical protein|nr:hypothetical protein [bacterium]
MGRKIADIVAIVWGGAILAHAATLVFNGSQSGSAGGGGTAYRAGSLAGVLFGLVFFSAGLYDLIRGSGKK